MRVCIYIWYMRVLMYWVLMGQTNTFATEKCLILTCGEHYPLLGSTDAKQNTFQLFMI